MVDASSFTGSMLADSSPTVVCLCFVVFSCVDIFVFDSVKIIDLPFTVYTFGAFGF